MNNPQQPDRFMKKAIFARRLKAWVVSSFALFMLLCTLWSFSTTRYVTRNRIGLGLIQMPDARLGTPIDAKSESIERLVQTAWAESTSSQAILDHLLHIKGIERREAGEPFKFDASSIQNAISYEFRLLKNRCEIILAFDGRGSASEKRLLDRVAVSIASHLALIPIRQLVDHQKNNDQNSRLAEGLDKTIDCCRNLQNDFLTIKQFDLQREQSRSDRRSNSDAIVAALKSEKSLLLDQRELLVQKQRELGGLGLDEPNMVTILEQLSNLDGKLARTEQRILDHQAQIYDSAKPRPSTFQNASFASTPSHSGTEDRRGELWRATAVSQLDQSLESLNQELVRLQSRAKLNPSRNADLDRVPVFVRSFEPASVQPKPGSQMGLTLISIIFLSILVGSAVAWRFKPLAEDIGFQSRHQIGNLLQIPVLAILNRRNDDDSPPATKLPLANWAAKAAELIVLVALAMIACILLFSPTIREAFADNPLHGLSEILWKIQGK